MLGREVPNVVLKTRVRDESIGGPNPFRWQDVHTADLFAGKRVVVFSLPGAFTPTCSTEQCPAYERDYAGIKDEKVDEIYCIAVNDAFVMYQWGKHLNVKDVKLLPDGSGDFTRRMGMLINKDHLGFGDRSWRYAMVVDDGTITAWFEEPGINDEGTDEDPYGESAPDKVLAWLKAQSALIMRAAAFLLLTGVLAASAAAQERALPYWASISAGEATMRTGPDRGYPAMWLYHRRDLPVRVLRVVGAWRQVQEQDGTTGWMLAALLSAKRTAVVTGAVRSVRETPADGGHILYHSEGGVVGHIAKCNGNWCRIAIGDKIGFIAQREIWGISPGETLD